MDVKNVVSSLERRGFIPYFVQNTDEAESLVYKLIPNTDSIGFGGSQTVQAMNLAKKLSDRGNKVFQRELTPNLDPQAVMTSAMFAEWFIASANAITEDGQIINTDGRSNRVASMIYGGKNTLLLVGINKIVKNIDEGIKRIREVAAPLNCKRLNLNENPCLNGGSCSDCKRTICKTTTIQHNPPTDRNYYVIIINQSLGF